MNILIYNSIIYIYKYIKYLTNFKSYRWFYDYIIYSQKVHTTLLTKVKLFKNNYYGHIYFTFEHLLFIIWTFLMRVTFKKIWFKRILWNYINNTIVLFILFIYNFRL